MNETCRISASASSALDDIYLSCGSDQVRTQFMNGHAIKDSGAASKTLFYNCQKTGVRDITIPLISICSNCYPSLHHHKHSKENLSRTFLADEDEVGISERTSNFVFHITHASITA